MSMIIYIAMVVLGLAGAATRFIPGWKTDNQVEELIEEVIKAKTGHDIDLSPDTPETKSEQTKSGQTKSEQTKSENEKLNGLLEKVKKDNIKVRRTQTNSVQTKSVQNSSVKK